MENQIKENLQKTLEFYNRKLADLERKLEPYRNIISEKDEVEKLITQLQKDLSDQPQSVTKSLKGLGRVKAMVTILNVIRKPLTRKELATELEKAGFGEGINDLAQSVSTSLSREQRKKKSRIIRMENNTWGLPEWEEE